MKRHRLPSAFAARAVLGLAGILAVTACGSLTQSGTQTGLQASLRAGASATYRAGNASSQPSTAAPSSPAPSSPARPGSAASSPTAAASIVVFDCLEQARVEPASFILTCADANSVLARLSWINWTAGQATATGVHELNDCAPDCAMGTFHDYPVVVTLASIGRLMLVPALLSGPLVPGTSIHPQAARPYAERLCAKAEASGLSLVRGSPKGA